MMAKTTAREVEPMDRAKLVDLKGRIAFSDVFTPDERSFVLDCLNRAVDADARLGVVAMHAPPNYLGSIETLWAALSLDDGGEGICAAPFGRNRTLPLIAADPTRLEQIIPVAKRIAMMFRKPVRLAKFTKREDVEIYQP
jgi:hypothetical protein